MKLLLLRRSDVPYNITFINFAEDFLQTPSQIIPVRIPLSEIQGACTKLPKDFDR